MPQQDDTRSAAQPFAGRLRAALLVGIGVFGLARLALVPRRFFDPDELEHAHAAWCWSKGMVLYKDFFEHHTPWYYFLLRPLFDWFRVDSSLESARHFLIAGRLLSVALMAVSVALVARIGRLWGGRRVGLLAAFLLITQPLFLKKSLEIRPDMLALPLFLASLWALVAAVSSDGHRAGRRLSTFAAAGLALGGAVMCTQKMLFVLPGLLPGLGLWLLASRRWARLADLVVFAAALVVPGLLTWALFVRLGAGHAFVANNFLLNAHWKHIPTGQLIRFVGTSAPVLALAAYRALAAARALFQTGPRRPAEVLLLGLLVWLFVSVALIPVAQMQYYLMPLPLVALFGAAGLLDLDERARGRFGARLLPWSLAVLSVLPLVALVMDWRSTNDKQLAQLRQVYDTTAPADLVVDGWQGMGVFRPHAFYYYFIHDELLLVLPQARVDAFVDDLETGSLRPALIVMDKRVAALGPRFLAFVRAHYTSRDGLFFYRAG